ncbi:MAG: hypothetical protein PVJ34_18070 [Anaerolineae bacterium]|jgi:signal transduction histidine kinase
MEQLGIVLGYAELLHDGDLGAFGPEQEQALVVVMNSLNRLQKTVDQIVTLMATELAARTLFPLNLVDVALHAVEKQRARAEQAGLDLIGPGILEGLDRGLLEQGLAGRVVIVGQVWGRGFRDQYDRDCFRLDIRIWDDITFMCYI